VYLLDHHPSPKPASSITVTAPQGTVRVAGANMSFLILTETSAGYALFKAKDKKLLKHEDLAKEMSSPEGACSM